MRTFFRISVHKPFESDPVWASGNASNMRVVEKITQSGKYKAENVAPIVAKLRLEQPADAVITVY